MMIYPMHEIDHLMPKVHDVTLRVNATPFAPATSVFCTVPSVYR